MPLIQLLLVIAFVGVLVWLLITYVPMPPQFRGLIVAVAVIAIVILLLQIFGVFDGGLYVGRHRGIH